MHSPLLATLTHARLRIAQGDLASARYILHEVLASDPDNAEAQTLLESLVGHVERALDSPVERSVPPREPGDPRKLKRSFAGLRADGDAVRDRKIRRLRDWATRFAAAPPPEPPAED